MHEPSGWKYARTALPAWIAGAALSYVAIRMGLSEQYRLAFLATAVLTAVLSFNPGLQRMSVGFLAPLVFVLGFYSQWIPSTAVGEFSARQTVFLRTLDFALILCVAAFLAGSIRSAWRIALWLCILLAAVYLLAGFSGSAGGAGSMVEWLMGAFGLDRESAIKYTIALRKSVHVLFYAIVAWSAYWAAWHGDFRGAKGVLYALAVAFVLAIFDESRQLVSRGRSGSGWDVLLDMSGATFAVAAASWAARRTLLSREVETSP